MASYVTIGHLVTALRDQEELWMADHSACLREVRMAVQKRSIILSKKTLAETLSGSLVQGARQLQQATKTWAWLTVQPSTINGTELGAQEW